MRLGDLGEKMKLFGGRRKVSTAADYQGEGRRRFNARNQR